MTGKYTKPIQVEENDRQQSSDDAERARKIELATEAVLARRKEALRQLSHEPRQ